MLWSTTSKVVFDAETFETVGDPPAPAESSMKASEQRQTTAAVNSNQRSRNRCQRTGLFTSLNLRDRLRVIKPAHWERATEETQVGKWGRMRRKQRGLQQKDSGPTLQRSLC